jgi:hypothetical protein
VRGEEALRQINAKTTSLQNTLWSTVVEATAAQRDPISALAVGGMNDVLNSQGYTQAAWWNRIPLGAWVLMWVVAIACNLLIGYGERRASRTMLFIFPSIVAVAFLLIADIDSPRHGIIRIIPQNLMTLTGSFRGP